MTDPGWQPQPKPHPRDLPPGTRLLFAIFAVVMIVGYFYAWNHNRNEEHDSCRIDVATHGLACALTPGSGAAVHI